MIAPSSMCRLLCCASAVWVGVLAGNSAPVNTLKHVTADGLDLVFEAKLHAANAGNLTHIEKELNTTFIALPKNNYGLLEMSHAVYTLHRYFSQNYGWHIHGLHGKTLEQGDFGFVPNYLAGLLRKPRDIGVSLKQVAAVAESIMYMTDVEVYGNVQRLYRIYNISETDLVKTPQAKEIITSYFDMFLRSGRLNSTSQSEILVEDQRFAQRYKGYEHVHGFFFTEFANFQDSDMWTFQDVEEYSQSIGKTYFEWNDLECGSLTETLEGLQGYHAGRVPLSRFYQKKSHMHWRFVEKQESLREMGLLDEKLETVPEILIPNYGMSRHNCLRTPSSVFGVCCPDLCEDRLRFIEWGIKAPSASPERIEELIVTYDRKKERPALSASVRERIGEVAAANPDGLVHIYDRSFSVWLHEAYPTSCPYPKQQSELPMSATEWLLPPPKEGVLVATSEEMQAIMEADVCLATNYDGCTSPPATMNREPAFMRFDETKDHMGSLANISAGAAKRRSGVVTVAPSIFRTGVRDAVAGAASRIREHVREVSAEGVFAEKTRETVVDVLVVLLVLCCLFMAYMKFPRDHFLGCVFGAVFFVARFIFDLSLAPVSVFIAMSVLLSRSVEQVRQARRKLKSCDEDMDKLKILV